MKTPGRTVFNAGAITGFGVLAGAIGNTGTITATGGTLTLAGSIDGSGTIGVATGGVLDVQQAVTASEVVAFAGGKLRLESLATMLGTIDTFASGDRIVLPGVTADGAAFASGLTLTDAGTAVGTLTLAGNYAGDTFRVGNSLGTSDVTVACFAEGSRIALADGERAVEQLRAGDVVRLADGGTERVRWIGHRRLRCDRHPEPRAVWPVRIAAGAFGPGLPARTLRLSPDHAVYCDGVLIPVRYLVNGATVRQEPVASVSYWHVELDRHAVLLAEGLPAESYLDTGNRAAFANGGTVAQATPEFSRSVWAARGCAELLTEGARVAAVRRRLLSRAAALGYAQTTDPALTVLADGVSLPTWQFGATWQVMLPSGVRRLRLTSRSFVPAETDADATDTRRLGVAIGSLALDGVDLAMDDARLGAGWHAPEPHWRWTDGNAAIAVAGARSVAFVVAITRKYWADGSGAVVLNPDRKRSPVGLRSGR